MTERTLLLRCAREGRYFMVATDYPSARVFDSTTSRLAAVVELPPRSRASLAAISLVSVALGAGPSPAPLSKRSSRAVSEAAVAAPLYAAAGLSDGTVLVKDVTADALLGHLLVSDTQHPITAMALKGGYLFALAANNTLHVVALHHLSARGGASAAATTTATVVLKTRTQADASAVTVLECDDDEDDDGEEGDKTTSKRAKKAAGGGSGDGVARFHVLVAGPTFVLHRVELHAPATVSSKGDDAGSSSSGRKNVMEKVLAFASQGTAVDYAWMGRCDAKGGSGGAAPAIAAVTASANEGAIRVWDLTYSSGAGAEKNGVAAAAPPSMTMGRCRRTLLCGQRIANVSVRNSSAGAVHVLATTFTGAVLLWSLGEQLMPRVVEPAPLQPTTAFFSSSASRLLYAVLSSNADADADDAGLGLLLMRGTFALPQFEFSSARELVANQEARLNGLLEDGAETSGKHSRAKQAKKLRKAASALGLGMNQGMTLVEVPPTSANAAAAFGGGVAANNSNNNGDEGDATAAMADRASAAFRVLDTVWAANRRRLAKRALMAPSESFAAVQTYHAATLKDLPVKQLTLEQRLRALSASVAKSAAEKAAADLRTRHQQKKDGQPGSDDDNDDDDEMGDGRAASATLPSLGLATVPLYQALHANDLSAVMELLSVAARSQEGMRSTVLSLQLPYALQLLNIISERLGITSAKSTVGAGQEGATMGGGGGLAAVSSRSPLLLWLDTLIHYRGMEMYAAQVDATARAQAAKALEKDGGDGGRRLEREFEKLAEEEEKGEAEAGADIVPEAAAEVSAPKDFVAPILHQYRTMCRNYDKLAALHGRLSVFNAVRPSERNQFVNRPRKMLSSNLELAQTPAALSGKVNAAHSVQDDDILFPVMFTELRTSKGPHVVRVRSRLAREKKRRQLATTDRALLRKARQMAKAESGEKKKSILDDSDDDEAALGGGKLDEMGMPIGGGGEEDIDLETMEALGLGSTDDDDDDDDSNDGALSSSGSHAGGSDMERSDDDDDDEEEGDGRNTAAAAGRRRKKARAEEMLADAPSSLDEDDDDDDKDDPDAELDSSDAGADFAKDSDDEVNSEMLELSGSDDDDSDDDDDDDENDEEEEEGRHHHESDASGADDDDDDGMGDDMAHMLAEMDEGNDDAKRETRKSKRVRTD